jgi:hypothetical protein
MRAALFRSGIAAIGSLLLWAAAQFGVVTLMCPDGNAWARVHAGTSAIVMDRGEQIARPGDGIFTCDTPHAVGPFVIHRDLACYCAPRQTSAAEVSDLVGGLCTVDTLQPTPDDAASACRYGRCSNFVDLKMDAERQRRPAR